MAFTYAKCRRDFEYLETLAELSDQVELDSRRQQFMENPTKAYAADLYLSGIQLWFDQHGDSFDDDKRVRRLRDEYGA